MKKHTLYAEVAYLCGILFVAMGAALMELADFGVSMIVAPAYLLYRWINPYWSVFTFGMAEYCLQGLLLAAMILLVGRFRLSYLFSFLTAVVYGLVLDGCMALAALLPTESVGIRLVWYAVGLLLCTSGVAMMFSTYLSPEVYELFVKEVSARYGVELHRFKTAYDCASCVVGLILSFVLFGFGRFVGISWGTVFCALVNGTLIHWFCRWYQKLWVVRDALPWRPFFTGEPVRR